RSGPMQRMHLRGGSGSRAETQTAGGRTRVAPEWEQEWRAADRVERSELGRASRTRAHRSLIVLAPCAVLAALVPAIYPLTPGFSESDTAAAVVAAVGTATVSIAIVPLANRLARGLPGAGAGDAVVFTLA